MKAAVPAANDIKYMTGGFHYFPAVLLQWFRIALRYVREVTRELINWQYYSSRAANISTLFMLEGDGKNNNQAAACHIKNARINYVLVNLIPPFSYHENTLLFHLHLLRLI